MPRNIFLSVFTDMFLYYYLFTKKSITYLVSFGSFFITVPSQVQGVFQYSRSFISGELIRNSHSIMTAHPDKKLIAIKLINIMVYFIILHSYIPKNNISCISLLVWSAVIPRANNSNRAQINKNSTTKTNVLINLTLNALDSTIE
jgi:hypothetical protein